MSLAGPNVSLGYAIFAGGLIGGTAWVASGAPADAGTSWLAYAAISFGALFLFGQWLVMFIDVTDPELVKWVPHYRPALTFLLSGSALFAAWRWFAGTPYAWLGRVSGWALWATAGAAVLMTVLRWAAGRKKR